MKTLNNAELTFLAVVGDPALLTKVLRLYSDKIYIFDNVATPHLSFMWNVYMKLLVKYREEYGLNLSRDLVAADLAEALQGSSRLPEPLLDKCDAILQRLTDGELPAAQDGLRLVENLVKLDANRKMMQKLNSNSDFIELQQSLDATKRVMSTLTEDDEDEETSENRILFNPFKEIDKLAVKSERIPTGINWMDEVSSGGGRAGELWLVLGPSGGGKTAISVQYSCAQTFMANNTLWATYEQSLQGDIAERIIACVTDTSLDEIRDRGFSNLDQRIQDKFWDSVAGVDDRLKALDMTLVKSDSQDPLDNGGMYSIWKHVKKLKEEGQPIKTLIVDWFGAMLSRIATITGQRLENCYRFLAQEEINIALKMAKKEKILIIFFHQTDMKTQHARPTYCPDMTCSKDMKDLCNYMDLVFTLGKRDVNSICYFSGAKTRKGQALTKTIQLIGDRAKFIQADGWLPNRDGNFYKPSSMSTMEDTRAMADAYSREID